MCVKVPFVLKLRKWVEIWSIKIFGQVNWTSTRDWSDAIGENDAFTKINLNYSNQSKCEENEVNDDQWNNEEKVNDEES